VSEQSLQDPRGFSLRRCTPIACDGHHRVARRRREYVDQPDQPIPGGRRVRPSRTCFGTGGRGSLRSGAPSTMPCKTPLHSNLPVTQHFSKRSGRIRAAEPGARFAPRSRRHCVPPGTRGRVPRLRASARWRTAQATHNPMIRPVFRRHVRRRPSPGADLRAGSALT